MKMGWLATLVGGAFCLSTSLCMSQIITYSDESSFLANSTIESKETFEEYPTPTHFYDFTVTLDSVRYTVVPQVRDPTLQGHPDWTIGIGLMHPTSGTNDFGSNLIRDKQIDFGPGGYVTAFGFWIGAGNSLPIPTYRITATDRTKHIADVNVNLENSPSGSNAQYVGFTSSSGIVSLYILARGPLGDGTNFGLDDVSRSHILVVPEQSVGPNEAMWLAAILLTSNCFWSYQERQRAKHRCKDKETSA